MVQGFAKQLKTILIDSGCKFYRQGRGDHEIWYSPISNQYFTVDAGCQSRHTANAVLKQAGLPKRF
jgi:hypothetical protein